MKRIESINLTVTFAEKFSLDVESELFSFFQIVPSDPNAAAIQLPGANLLILQKERLAVVVEESRLRVEQGLVDDTTKLQIFDVLKKILAIKKYPEVSGYGFNFSASWETSEPVDSSVILGSKIRGLIAENALVGAAISFATKLNDVETEALSIKIDNDKGRAVVGGSYNLDFRANSIPWNDLPEQCEKGLAIFKSKIAESGV